MTAENTDDLAGERHAHEQLRSLRVRREPGGRYVAFLPGAGRYVFVNQAGAEMIERLVGGERLSGICAELAPEWSSADAEGFIAAVLGAREAVAGNPASSAPSAWPLAAELGAAADRCDTFGMPL